MGLCYNTKVKDNDSKIKFLSHGLYTIYTGKAVGPRFVLMVSKTPPEWEIPFEIGVYHLSRGTPIYRRSSGTGLTIGARPGTGRKTQMERTFTAWKLRFGILDYLSKKSRFFRKFSIWETEISLPIYIPNEISGFLG